MIARFHYQLINLVWQFRKSIITSEGFGEMAPVLLTSFGERGKGWVACGPERASVARQKELVSSDRGLKSSSAISPSSLSIVVIMGKTSFTLVVFNYHNFVSMCSCSI